MTSCLLMSTKGLVGRMVFYTRKNEDGFFTPYTSCITLARPFYIIKILAASWANMLTGICMYFHICLAIIPFAVLRFDIRAIVYSLSLS